MEAKMEHKNKKKKKNNNGNHATTNRSDHERSLDYYMQNFKEYCEQCGEPLSVIKHRPKSHAHREVVAATCMNRDYKGNAHRCGLYQVEIRFIEKFI